MEMLICVGNTVIYLKEKLSKTIVNPIYIMNLNKKKTGRAWTVKICTGKILKIITLETYQNTKIK